jgi:hypothetical protein
MAVTKSFKELVKRRVASDVASQKICCAKASTPCWPRRRDRQGDPARLHQGNGWLRKAWRSNRYPAKSLMSITSPSGNRLVRNLFRVSATCKSRSASTCMRRRSRGEGLREKHSHAI